MDKKEIPAIEHMVKEQRKMAEEISVFCVGEKINKINLDVVERIHRKYKEYFSSREYVKPNEESESIYIEFVNEGRGNSIHIFLRGEEFEVTVQRLKDLRKICESTFGKCSTEYLFDVIDNIFKQFIAVETEPSEEKYELEYPEAAKFKFFINSMGGVQKIIFGKAYKDEFEQGHVKFTEEEAKLEVKRRDLITRFNQFRDKCNGDWKPDFKKPGEKYYICNEENSNLQIGWRVYNNNYPKFSYFKNKKDCERAIELFGDEIKELF